MTVLVKAGEIDLYLANGNTMVLPPGYGMVHDTDGAILDKCSLFFGPIDATDERPSGEIPSDARDYFGGEYELRIARVDVPEGKWNLVGHVSEIVYYRPGRHEGDWHHVFERPQELYEQARWLWLRFPDDCRVTYRGIEKP